MIRAMHSLKSIRFIPFLLLIATICFSGIAAMPAVLPTPSAPTAVATANAGEIRVSWQSVADAQFYTVAGSTATTTTG